MAMKLPVRQHWNAWLLVGYVALAMVPGMRAAPIDDGSQWTRFHGPNGSGVATGDQLPVDWQDSDYAWQINLPGTGAGSPVVWNTRLFITSCDSAAEKWMLQCIDTGTGETLWQKDYPVRPYRMHTRNSLASSTPALDANHVYVSYADAETTILRALTHDGAPVWTRDFGPCISEHGFGMSPIVYRDKVIFFHSQTAQRLPAGTKPGQSRMIAVNAADGSDAWTVPLKTTRTCYSLPCIWNSDHGTESIIGCNTGNGFFSINPESGRLNWECQAFAQRTVASVLHVDGLLIGSCGSGGGGNTLVAMRPDPSDALKVPEPVYTLQRSNYVPSPVSVNGLLFLFTDKGLGTCVDLQTGEQKWQQRLSSGFSGSPVATMKAIYVADEEGKLLVISPSSEYQLLSKHFLGQSTFATPAISDNQIFFRTSSRLYCLR